jgi:DNA replicative helicase MCM subunit Mcm2 (Cdc46/Mcm family)
MSGIRFSDCERLPDPTISKIAAEIVLIMKSGSQENEILNKIIQRNWRKSDVLEALEYAVEKKQLLEDENRYYLPD